MATLPFASPHVTAPARNRPWLAWLGPVLSLVILAIVLWQLRDIDVRRVIAMTPRRPLFWLTFAAYYCAAPLADWLIFRRLWAIPLAGFGALLRKLVYNELLLGYLGELYFYSWARRHGRIVAAPFGALKDVTILSAMTGNAATLVMVLLAAPVVAPLRLGLDPLMLTLSIAIVVVSSFAVMLLRRRVFSLPPAELRFVVAVQAARIVVRIALNAALWHMVLPGVEWMWWIVLSTARQLLSRLPLVPNKDIVFIAVAAFVVGRDTQLETMIVMIGSLIVTTHLLVGAALGASELAHAR